MDERTIDAGAISLSVRDWPGAEPAIVGLHGLASNARWWDLVAARLSPAHRFVALDLRGHGRSDRPDGGYSLEEVAADVAAAVATLGIGDHVVAGHSWGASVALQHGASADVLGVACVDGGISDLRAVFGGTWEAAAPMMTPPEFSGITVDTLRGWVTATPLVEGSDADTAAEILLGNFEENDGELRPRLSLARHMQIARHLFEADPTTALSGVRCPVLLLPATEPPEQMPLRRAWVDAALARLGERGEVAWINGSHDLPVERPEAVATALSEWLSRVLAGPQPSTTS